MLSICVGEMGMSVEEFYSLRGFELDAIMLGYRRRWFEDWKRTQWLSYATVQSHSSKKVKPDDVLHLSDIEKDIFPKKDEDVHEEEPELTPEDRARIMADADAFAKKLTESHSKPINTESPFRDISNPDK